MDNKERFAMLSPEKREVLLRKLMEKDARGLTQAPAVVVADKENRHLPFPLVEVQQVYWLGQTGLFDLGTHAANIYVEFRINYINEDLRKTVETKVENALNHLIRDHDMLRMIVLPGGMQKILPQVKGYQIPYVDLYGLGECEIEERLEKVRDRLKEEKTPVNHWPLFNIVGHCFNKTIVMQIKINALLMDGTSMTRFLSQWLHAIQDSYDAPPKLEFSYRDYALAWEKIKKTQFYHQERNHWLRRMPELLPGPQMTLSTYVYPGAHCKVIVRDKEFMDKHHWEKLNELAVKSGVSPSAVLLAAYADVIAYWSYKAKFSIGVINTFRPPIHPQIDNIIGNFNTFGIVAIDALSGNFIERVKAIQAQIVHNIDNPYFTGPQLVREMNKIHGRGTHVPMTVYFNSVFNLQKVYKRLRENESIKNSNLAHEEGWPSLINVDVVETNIYPSQTYLMPTMYEGDNGELRCKLTGRPGLFPQGMLEDIFNAWKKLVNKLVSEDKIRYEHWPESISKLIKANAVAVLPDVAQKSRDVNSLLMDSTRLNDNRTAVVHSSVSLSYGELYSIANIITERLLQTGIKPGENQMVAVIMEKGWEPIAALLGIFGAGAIYLPLDMNMSCERLLILLRVNKVKVVLTQSRVGKQVGLPGNIDYIYVDEYAAGKSKVSAPDIHVLTEQAACAAYYDAEGINKIVISHGMTVSTIMSSVKYFGVTAGDRLLSLYPHTVDMWLFDILGMLFVGGTIVLTEAQRNWDPFHWTELVQREQITVWNSPVHILEEALTCWERQFKAGHRPLRLFLLSDARVGSKVVMRINSANCKNQIFHLWRSGEVGLWSMIEQLNEDKDIGTKFSRYYEGHCAHVMNGGLGQCPKSVLGHVYIGGNDLVETYAALNEKCGAKIFRNPRTGEKLIRTRYVGRYSGSNAIEICGYEEDYKLRFNGYPVALFDVEEKLEQHPDVRLAVVLAEDIVHNRARLMACVAITDESTVEANGLKIFLRDRLPYYAIPDDIYSLKSLPTTIEGNIDRSQLLDWLTAMQTFKPFMEPQCQFEFRLLQIWDELLGERVDNVNANWFDVGGDSWNSAQLISKVEKEFGKTIVPTDFFYDPTIKNLANILKSKKEEIK